MHPHQIPQDSERIGAVGPDPYDSNDNAPKWSPNIAAQDFLKLYPDFQFVDAPPFQFTSEPAQPFPSSTGNDLHSTFRQSSSNYPSTLNIEQNDFSSSFPPWVSSIHPQTIATLGAHPFPVHHFSSAEQRHKENIGMVPYTHGPNAIAPDWYSIPQNLSSVQSVWHPRYHGATDVHPPTVGPTTPPPILPPGVTCIKIPQRTYDQGSKQCDFKRSEPIFFSTTSDRPGINLGDALRKDFTHLNGRDDPVLQGTSSISCRLLFPGYSVIRGSCQIPARDSTKERNPIRRGKLAYEVAKKVKQYLDQLTKMVPDDDLDIRWRVGHPSMCIDNMLLVKLDQVSKASFQPEIWVVALPPPHVPAQGN